MVVLFAACTPPVRQFDLKDQPLSCEEANRYAHEALKAMNYRVTVFTPAAPGGTGVLKAAKEDRAVTVAITCTGAGPTLDAGEDGKFLGQVEFKRAFYLAFTGVMSQQKANAAVAQREAALPPAQRKQQGLEILVTPAPGVEARMDFNLDFGSAEVLPVRIAVHNRSQRRYRLDPEEIVMVRSDRARVHPLSLADVAQRVRAASTAAGAPADVASITSQLDGKRFTTEKIGPDSSAEGYLFYPLGTYQRARVLVTEADSDESEGVVVEFLPR